MAIVASTLGVHAVQAGIQVLDDVGAPVSNTAWSLNVTPLGYRLVLKELHSPWQETWYVVRANGGERFIAVDVNVDGPPAGSPVFIRLEGAHSIDAIQQNGSAETILDFVAVEEDIGHVEIESIGTLIAGRDIIGPIVATTNPNPVRGIGAVHADRHIHGSILAEHGRVELIQAGGAIGQSGSPVMVRARYGLGTLHSDGAAVIDLDLRTESGTGTAWRLEAATLDGSIFLDGFATPAGVEGEPHVQTQILHADLVLGGNLAGTDPIIQLAQMGLRSQVVVNADDAGGIWTAPVRLGTPGDPGLLELHGPTYAPTPAAIGGGAVGVIPFRMHMSACEPVSGSTPTWTEQDPVMATLRWYGPIAWPGGTPLVVERRELGSTGAWSTVPSAHFLFIPVPDEYTAMRIEPSAPGLGFQAGWSYRLRPDVHLVCDLLSYSAVAADDLWEIEIEDPEPVCMGDLNEDGSVGVTDLLVLIACWGEVHDPLSDASDLNRDERVDVLDLLELIARWGACSGE